jgi:hypothetical protein
MANDEITNVEQLSTLEKITQTVLYEGYSVFPYRRSSTKNVKPVPFGTIYPQVYQKHHPEVHSTTQTECIIQGSAETTVEITVRFLHLQRKRLLKIDFERFGQNQFQGSDAIEAGGETHSSGWRAIERKIKLGKHKIAELIDHPLKEELTFEDEQSSEMIYHEDGKIAGNIILKQSEISGNVNVLAKPVGIEEEGYKITVKITNTTRADHPESCTRDEIYEQSFLSTNTILQAEEGTFISQADPPETWEKVSETLKNINTWPVLVEKDDRKILSSPIILYDYPEIAPESLGDLFDSTEIEELLLLQIAALPEKEKKEIDQADGKMEAMLRRIENSTPEDLMKLHGRLTEIKNEDKLNE